MPHVNPDDGAIAIEVSRHIPAFARAKGTTCSWAGYLSLIVFLFPLVGLLQIYKGFAFHSRAVRAFTDGEPAMASVVRAGQDYSVRVNGRMAFRVVWQFEVEGAQHQGSLHSMDRAAIADLLEAKSLVILYLPSNPRASTVYLDD